MVKLLKNREKIFAFIALTIINILCIVKFLITFIQECNLVSYLTSLGSEISYSSLNYIKVMFIICVCFAIILLILSFIYLFIKKSNIKRNLIIVSITIALLVVTFYFTSRFICGDFYSKAMYLTRDYDKLYLYDFAYEYHINAVFMLLSLVLSVISSVIAFSISNEILTNKNTENKETTSKTAETSAEEDVLNNEIEKLKAKIRVKNLESEYIKLKSQLDEHES